MKTWTVRGRIILGFALVILLMIGLSVFAYGELRGIEAQAITLRGESVPGLYIIGKLHAISISTYTSVQQLVLEQDAAKMQQIMSYLEGKTTERLELLKEYEPTIRSDQERELYKAT